MDTKKSKEISEDILNQLLTLEDILNQLLSYESILNYDVPQVILTKIIEETVSIEGLKYLAVKAGEIILERYQNHKNSLLYVIEHLPYPSRRFKTSSLRMEAWKKFKKLNPTDADLWFIIKRAKDPSKNLLKECSKLIKKLRKDDL